MGWTNYLVIEDKKIAFDIGKVDDADIDTKLAWKIHDIQEYAETHTEQNLAVKDYLTSKIDYDSNTLLLSLLVLFYTGSDGKYRIVNEYNEDIDWGEYTVIERAN